MANVVLCSEMERGPRALVRLASCATELRSKGHSVRLVCNDLGLAHRTDAFDKMPIFQAPQIPVSERNRQRRLVNHSSILLAKGFANRDELVPALRSWLHIFATSDADLVMTDAAPAATLAAKLLMIPCVMMGMGYSFPPKKTPLPSLMPWTANTMKKDEADAQLEGEDEPLLVEVNAAVKALNFNNVSFKSAQELFSHADHWVTTLAEIDHYGKRDAKYVVRWSDKHQAPDPQWPAIEGEKVFVQMSTESPHLEAVVNQLAKRGAPTLMVIPDAPEKLIARTKIPNIRLQREPVNLKKVTEQCRVVISNCEHNVLYDVLLAGTPSILLPDSHENTVLAYRVARRKLGFPGPAKADKLNLDQLIEKATTNDQIWANTSRVALKYENHESLLRVHDLIAEKLPE